MKVRTCVMVACMTVVPAIALFSHRLPPGVREVMRTRLWEPVEGWVASLARRDAAPSGSTSSEPVPIVAAIELRADPVSQSIPALAAPTAVAVQPPTPSSAALAALGATAIDCRPFDGIAGTHVASCRVAVDGAGQLHRVFQAAGSSPDEALTSLFDAVRVWKDRMAGGAVIPRL